MTRHFIYPSHPMKPSVIEPMYADEGSAMKTAGFSVSVFADSVIHNGKPLKNIPAGATVVYRGWMLNESEYRSLQTAIVAANAEPLTSVEQYLAAHHCPNWYPLITEFTPETRVFALSANLESELRSLGWNEFFIKDYVKSLKTSRGSILRDPAEIGPLVAEMKHFRGEIEGGLCVRRVEPFIADSEQRYFVVRGKASAANGAPVPQIVESVAGRIPSAFFSVDAIRRDDGVLRVVEVGDGQVSDLVEWEAGAFAAMWTGLIVGHPADSV
jgi:hypothetical protein